MAAKTPVTTKSTDGYVNPDQGYYGSDSGITVTGNMIAAGDRKNDLKGLRHSVWFFSDIDTGDHWMSGIKGIRTVAWSPVDATDDVGGVCCAVVSSGRVNFIVTNADSQGWLHVWSRA
jgi:hypothetical protein